MEEGVAFFHHPLTLVSLQGPGLDPSVGVTVGESEFPLNTAALRSIISPPNLAPAPAPAPALCSLYIYPPPLLLAFPTTFFLFLFPTESFSDFTKSLREYEQYRHEQNEANANEHDNNDADRGNDSDGASESEAVTSDSESEETAFVYGDGSPGDGFDPDDAQNVRLHVLQVRQSDAHCSSDSDSEL